MIMRIFKIIACCIFALTFMNVNVYGDRIRKYKVRSYIPIVFPYTTLFRSITTKEI